MTIPGMFSVRSRDTGGRWDMEYLTEPGRPDIEYHGSVTGPEETLQNRS